MASKGRAQGSQERIASLAHTWINGSKPERPVGSRPRVSPGTYLDPPPTGMTTAALYVRYRYRVYGKLCLQVRCSRCHDALQLRHEDAAGCGAVD